MTIGERIRATRIERGMTQQDIAAKLGVMVTTVSRYELGTREPKLNTIGRIADALRVGADLLLETGRNVESDDQAGGDYALKPFALLRGAMIVKGITTSDLARELKISRTSLNARLQGNYPWKLDEVYAILDLLRLPENEMHRYFPRGGRFEGREQVESYHNEESKIPCSESQGLLTLADHPLNFADSTKEVERDENGMPVLKGIDADDVIGTIARG